jgi:hypothetical protein
VLAELPVENVAGVEPFWEKHSGELMFLILSVLVLLTLLIVVPQLLRHYHRALELQHAERMRALEQGHPLSLPDDLSRLGGWIAFLVPMVVVCAAGTVTVFLAAYRSESLFAVALVSWVVAGVVSLAAVTGGVALLGRLAQLQRGEEEEEPAENVLED